MKHILEHCLGQEPGYSFCNMFATIQYIIDKTCITTVIQIKVMRYNYLCNHKFNITNMSSIP